MEMGNVPKRQQPDHRKDNSRRSPTGLQCSEKFPHPEASFSWPLNKCIYTSSVIINAILNSLLKWLILKTILKAQIFDICKKKIDNAMNK